MLRTFFLCYLCCIRVAALWRGTIVLKGPMAAPYVPFVCPQQHPLCAPQ